MISKAFLRGCTSLVVKTMLGRQFSPGRLLSILSAAFVAICFSAITDMTLAANEQPSPVAPTVQEQRLPAPDSYPLQVLPVGSADGPAVSGSNKYSTVRSNQLDFRASPTSGPMPSSAPITADQLQVLSRQPNDLPNLHSVAGGLLRGGQPTARGLTLLKQAGVRTIINLRTEDIPVNNERMLAKQIGLNFIHLPMYIFEKPNRRLFLSFLREVGTAANQPVYVHCQYGRDRTGTVVGAYRIAVDGWTFDKAFEEMMARGFRPGVATLTSGLHDFARDNGDRKSVLPSPGFSYSDSNKRYRTWRHPGSN
ncbi:MAG: dual specificity protein phosphatase family protein [Candidatus Obscuribacterales bacterium]|nr:dual specificity protein phosphatase family protein [Candidatus Obscuribacterales bacterium]